MAKEFFATNMAGKKWPHIFVALHFPAHKNVALPPPRLVRLTAASSRRGARSGGAAVLMQNFSFGKRIFQKSKCAEATRNLRINGDGLKLLPPCPLLTPPANRLSPVPPLPAGWPPSKIALIFLHSPGKDKLRLQFSLA
mgnify:CR=1 FL=1